MKKIIYSLLTLIILTFIGIQFVSVERTNPPINQEADLIVPSNIKSVLKKACYDCHSNETEWPAYSFIAPVSWFVADHVNHGRGELNFSEWNNYKLKKKDHKLEEIWEMVEYGYMPLSSYKTMHSEADLSAEEKDLIKDWANAERAKLNISEEKQTAKINSVE